VDFFLVRAPGYREMCDYCYVDVMLSEVERR
jgi:hypothetical protein